jgi:hypothetical protein
MGSCCQWYASVKTHQVVAEDNMHRGCWVFACVRAQHTQHTQEEEQSMASWHCCSCRELCFASLIVLFLCICRWASKLET